MNLTSYLPLFMGLGLIILAFFTYRIGKVFTEKAEQEQESKALFLVWKLFWLIATAGWLTAVVFAFLNIIPYIQQLVSAMIHGVYI